MPRVEDVISTGGTISAALARMEKIGANVVGLVAAIREASVWQHKPGAINPGWPGPVHAPIRCPLFRKDGDGWAPDMSTMPDP